LKAIGGRLPMAWWHRCWLYRGIQHFNAIGSVESLDVGVQSRTTWPDEIPDDVVGVGPRLHDMASEFRAIVTANRCRLAVPFAKLLENLHHAAATDAEVDLDGQHFTCEVIDHVEGSERTTIGQRVAHEVLSTSKRSARSAARAHDVRVLRVDAADVGAASGSARDTAAVFACG